MRVTELCPDTTPHRWTEWRYDETVAGAVKHCERCGVTIDRSRTVTGHRSTEPADTTPIVAPLPATVLEALGVSPFTEELRGNLARAADVADRILATADPGSRADALLNRAWVHVLQGEIHAARPLLLEARTLGAGDANIRLRAVSHLLNATHHEFNLFPDRCGVGAVEVTARWGGARELIPLDTEWNEAVRVATSGVAQFEAWITYGFISQLLPSRYMLDTRRYSPSDESLADVLGMATSRTDRLRQIGTTLPWPAIVAYADCVEAEMQRRAGDGNAAEVLLTRAQAGYAAAGDAVGQALCIMTRADWACAPFSTPLSWNFALVDSSGPSNALSTPLEALERGGMPSPEVRTACEIAYGEADGLFAAGMAPRGKAAIALRRAYLSACAQQWSAAAAHAASARATFAEAGDHLNASLAATHLLMAALSGDDPSHDAWQIATGIGTWGRNAGSFSVALGCGVLVNRLARDWLIRGGQSERALACSGAARALFQALGADVNAAQCLVDVGMMHSAVGMRRTALTSFETALDEYAAIADAHPPIASNLRQRIVLLGADVYQLALQDTDADGMERAAGRLATQRRVLPTASSLHDAMQRMQTRMAAMLAGEVVTDADPEDLDALMTLAPLGQMADSVVRNSAVLAPLYRSRAARASGDTLAAEQHIAEALQAVPAVHEGERDMLHAVVLAERKDFAGAAAAMRAYITAGGANAGLGGDIARMMQQAGGGTAEAEMQLQVRRTHEQAFAAFVMVRAYDDAAMHLEALERIAGHDWWKHDRKPWQPLCDIAEFHEHRGDAVRARQCYADAVELLETRRGSLSRDELKVALASDKGAQYVYLLAARAAVTQGDIAAGFVYAERAKSRALLDLMAVSRAPVPGAESPEMATWREQGMQLQVTRGLLAQQRSQRTTDPARVADLESQLRAQEMQHRDAERVLAQVHPGFQQAVSASAPVLDPDAVRKALPRGTVLLEYFFVGDELLAWALVRDAAPVVHHATFDTHELVRDIRALHTAIDAFTPWQPVAERIATHLLVPFATQLANADAVIVVPHGAAHLLPFHILPVNGAMLADRHTVSYLPSASTLQWLPQRDVEPAPGAMLVVGNPTLDLPAAVREAEFVAAQFPGASVLIGEAATESAVRGVIPRVSLVHFATHGILDEVMPLNSSLLLAGGDELTVYELMLLRLEARLVVLSACSTGQGETTGGDDVLGLTRALLAAGAEAAVVSLWPVDDHATALFMQAFYTSLARGQSPRRALHDAQVAMRRMTITEIEDRTRGQRRSPAAAAANIPADEGGYRHPYFWAPFVLVGR